MPDPFLGTATTTFAAMASGRNSIGYEIDAILRDTFSELKDEIVPSSNKYIQNRILKHIQFVIKWIKAKGGFKYKNKFYGFPVMTSQEKELILIEHLTFQSALDFDLNKLGTLASYMQFV